MAVKGGTGELERLIVRGLIRTMKDAGWTCYEVYDGGELVKVSTEDEAMDAVFAVDVSQLWFRNADNQRHSVLLIAGNGDDIISDWSYSLTGADDFNQVMYRYMLVQLQELIKEKEAKL